MLIDGFTVIAQIINFLILVALLKRFLYKPVIKAMKQRELKITNYLSEASVKLEKAEEMAKLYEEKLDELTQQKQILLETIKQEVKQEKIRLLEQVREEIKTTRRKWYQSLQRDQEAWLTNLNKQITKQVILISSKVLQDLAGADLEEEIINIFILHWSEINPSYFQMEKEPLIVKTSFDLTSQQRERLTDAIGQNLTQPREIKFQTKSQLICGIEVSSNNYQIAWNIQHYLENLDQVINTSYE